jgi:hypothetical protein
MHLMKYRPILPAKGLLSTLLAYPEKTIYFCDPTILFETTLDNFSSFHSYQNQLALLL